MKRLVGVASLHLEGIIHRDLAARNVLIDEANNALIADFGLSVKSWVDTHNATQTRGFFRGPYKWMAPESLSHNIFSVKSDVWSFGVTFWELLSQRKPFEKYDIYYVREHVVKSHLRIPIASKWPQMIQNLLIACVRTNPADRPDFKTLGIWLESMESDYIKDPSTYDNIVPALSNDEMKALDATVETPKV